MRIRWRHLSTIPGTTPHCLVSTEGNVNVIGTRNLVYAKYCMEDHSLKPSPGLRNLFHFFNNLPYVYIPF